MKTDRDFWDPAAKLSVAGGISETVVDFWLPLQLRKAERELSSLWSTKKGSSLEWAEEVKSRKDVRGAPADYWSPVANQAEVHERSALDWGRTATLPWYDSDAHENPYLVRLEPPTPERLALKRGRWLSQLANIPQPRRRAQFADFFAEVFECFPSAQTFQALSDLALDDVDPEALKNGCQFRIAFLESPRLAYRRSPQIKVPSAHHEPEVLLSWRRAVRLSLLCWGADPSTSLDDDWFGEWIDLDLGHPLYWSYLDYIEWHLQTLYLDYWVTDSARRPPEIGDESLRKDIARLRGWSRTGSLAIGQSDIIGVAYPEPRTPRIVSRQRGPHSRPKLLD